VFVHHFQQRDLTNAIVVAPDIGHAKSAARFASDLGLPVTAAMKERVSDSQVRIGGIVGQQVKGYRQALIYDDEIATGGSILELSRLLIEEGIEQILVACTHGVFVHGGMEKLAAVPQIVEIVTTDTVRIPAKNAIQSCTCCRWDASLARRSAATIRSSRSATCSCSERRTRRGSSLRCGILRPTPLRVGPLKGICVD